MILSMENQAVLFIIASVVGFFIGFVYDVLRIFRRTVKHKNIFVQLEDIIYWIFVSFVMFYIMLNRNDGEIRAFNIFGCIMGMLLYFLTLSPIVMKVFVTIIEFLKKVVITIITILLTPIKLVLHILAVPMAMLKGKLKQIKAKLNKIFFKSKQYAKIKRMKVKNTLRIMRKKM